jgi:prevent-host-death family protein
MRTVGIADLKAHLSEHLRAVRRGERLTIVDRGTPVATLSPVAAAASGLVVRPAKGKLSDFKPRGAPRPDIDAVAVLLEDRERGRR